MTLISGSLKFVTRLFKDSKCRRILPAMTDVAICETKHPELVQDENIPPPQLRFSKLSSDAHIPTRGSPLAAGYDLYAAHETVLPAKGRGFVKTDIQIALPDGCYGRVAPRSGLALKNGIDVGAGVIDQDYRGNVGIVLFNFGDEDFKVQKGDRVAQLICERIYLPALEECESLDNTKRGANGYGSTGI